MTKSLPFSIDLRRLFVLAEVTLVIFIVGAVIIGVWHAARSVIADQKFKRTTQQITSFVQKLRELNSGNTLEKGIQSVIIEAGIAPKDMVKGNRLISVWDSEVLMEPLGYHEKKEHFTLTFYNVPSYDCMLLIERIGQQNTLLGLKGLATTNGEWLDDFPVSDSSAQQSCATNLNIVALAFKMRG